MSEIKTKPVKMTKLEIDRQKLILEQIDALRDLLIACRPAKGFQDSFESVMDEDEQQIIKDKVFSFIKKME